MKYMIIFVLSHYHMRLFVLFRHCLDPKMYLLFTRTKYTYLRNQSTKSALIKLYLEIDPVQASNSLNERNHTNYE